MTTMPGLTTIYQATGPVATMPATTMPVAADQ
jgi:hypothetical protein